jgi:hypothetical protein
MLPKRIADTSKISPQIPIIHRANTILQLARPIANWHGTTQKPGRAGDQREGPPSGIAVRPPCDPRHAGWQRGHERLRLRRADREPVHDGRSGDAGRRDPGFGLLPDPGRRGVVRRLLQPSVRPGCSAPAPFPRGWRPRWASRAAAGRELLQTSGRIQPADREGGCQFLAALIFASASRRARSVFADLAERTARCCPN